MENLSDEELERRLRAGLERLGIEVAQRYLDSADLVLFCVESGREPLEDERRFLEELGEVPVVILRTKADLRPSAAEASVSGTEPDPVLPRVCRTWKNG